MVEAKYSINEITVNNVRQTLTNAQKTTDYILLKGTSVQIYMRGAVSADRISAITNPPGASGGVDFGKDQNITGNISQITVVVNGTATPPPASTPPPPVKQP